MLKNLDNEEYKGRWVRVHWAENTGGYFKAALRILSSDRFGLLADLTAVFAAMHIKINTVNARELKNGSAEINLTVDISSMSQLESVMTKLCKVNGVFDVSRSSNKILKPKQYINSMEWNSIGCKI